MYESKYDPTATLIRPVEVDIICSKCGLSECLSSNIINGELFIDDYICPNCAVIVDISVITIHDRKKRLSN